ncbi:MAG: hypothetical protein ABIN83_04970 [Sphingomicrobium sp.]
MRLAFIQSPADWRRPNVTQRALAIALTLLAELLFLLILLGFGPSSWVPTRQSSQSTDVIFLPEPPAPRAPRAPSKSEKPRAPTPVRAPVLPPSPLAKSPYVKVTEQEFAAADISKLGSAGGQGKETGPSSASAGTGPGGVTLYQAEWFRRPTSAEINGYMTKNVEAGSWAEVACKTIPDNRVENCQALDESPPGSGLARAIRQAGWQFRIRPPRIDGKPMVGTWVRVHIEFTH